jgi:hypothetical protein
VDAQSSPPTYYFARLPVTALRLVGMRTGANSLPLVSIRDDVMYRVPVSACLLTACGPVVIEHDVQTPRSAARQVSPSPRRRTAYGAESRTTIQKVLSRGLDPAMRRSPGGTI